MAKLEWFGDDIKKRWMRACAMGINRTMAVCVAVAKDNHPWENRTGTAERSISIARAAKATGEVLYGIWGSLQVAYFLALEFGTQLRRAYPTLRPTAARVYPQLPRLTAEAYRGLA